ncbi:MAG TPA: metal ABC transporter permease [Phycisphaerales bacterium]|nr:metal ABC transporter permease [Phycisphaerales bacterium]
MTALLSDVWHLVTLDAPYNTRLVLRSVGVLGAACGAVGVFLLLRRRSLVADALAHAALPGVCVGFLLAVVLGLDARSLAILLPAAAIAGALSIASIHALTRLPRVREDAAIGIVLSVFFAVGVVLLSAIQALPVSQKAGLNHFIFGHAATMSASDGRAILIASSIAIIVLVACFKELRLLCFDSSFAGGMGFSRIALDGILMSLVTLLTVVGLHAVGALLIVALLIIPAAAARFWTDHLGVMAVIAMFIGGIGAYVGAASSAAEANVPTGPAIVLCCGALFFISMAIAPKRGLLAEHVRRIMTNGRIGRQHLLRAMYERGEIVGNALAPVLVDDLQERRSWPANRVRRLLARAARQGDVEQVGSGYVLTAHGREAAAKLVRAHRLLEYYLATRADVAPHELDRAADDIEHALGPQLIEDLERSLQSQQAIRTGAMPDSPHELSQREGGT